MDPEDFLSPEVGITAVVVAAVASPRVRKVVRQGAVYGLAGILMAGDAITAFARGVGQGAQHMAQNANANGVGANGTQQQTSQVAEQTAGEPS